MNDKLKVALVMPVHAAQITQGWGENPAYYARYGQAGHNGIDMVSANGDLSILAAAEGVVQKIAAETGGYGTYMVVRHAGFATLYAHLSTLNVQNGERVKAGQIIAQMGWSGNVIPADERGTHLHFGLLVDGVRISGYPGGYTDPTPYLAEQAPPGEKTVPKSDDPEEALVQLPADFVVAVDELNLRGGPSVNQALLGCLRRGTRLHAEQSIQDETGNIWYKVNIENVWIAFKWHNTQFLTKN